PADDFAALLSVARPDVVDAVLRAYAHVRVERPDEHLLARARLGSELALLAALLRAVAARNDVVTEATTARLRRLDDTVHNEAQARRLRIVPAPPVSSPGPRRGDDDRSSLTDPPEDSNPLHAAGDEDATDVIDAVAGAAASADADRSDQDSESADQRGHDDDATEAYEPVGSDADDEPEHVEGALTEQGDEPGEGR